MSEDRLSVILLLSEGPWQRALAHRIASVPGVRIVGIVLQHIPGTSSLAWIRKNLRRQPVQVASKVTQRLFFRSALQRIDSAAIEVFGEHGQPRAWPDVPLLEVSDINAPDSVAWMRARQPGLICVSGTRMIKQPIFDLAPAHGLLNLHTGISPFYKGGPNCTLWCLAEGEPQYIGATLHVLDPGIDTGSLLATQQVDVCAGDDAATLVCKAVSTGHDLYERVVGAIARGEKLRAVPQRELGEGRTYYTREWNVAQLARALFYVRSGQLGGWVRRGRPGRSAVKLVDVLGSAQ